MEKPRRVTELECGGRRISQIEYATRPGPSSKNAPPRRALSSAMPSPSVHKKVKRVSWHPGDAVSSENVQEQVEYSPGPFTPLRQSVGPTFRAILREARYDELFFRIGRDHHRVGYVFYPTRRPEQAVNEIMQNLRLGDYVAETNQICVIYEKKHAALRLRLAEEERICAEERALAAKLLKRQQKVQRIKNRTGITLAKNVGNEMKDVLLRRKQATATAWENFANRTGIERVVDGGKIKIKEMKEMLSKRRSTSAAMLSATSANIYNPHDQTESSQTQDKTKEIKTMLSRELSTSAAVHSIAKSTGFWEAKDTAEAKVKATIKRVESSRLSRDASELVRRASTKIERMYVGDVTEMI